MIRKISKKVTRMIMALTMVLSYVMPITTVFAATTRTVNVTATDIVAHIKITSSSDQDNPGPISEECLTTESDPGMQKCPMSFDDDSASEYYIHIEPDIITRGKITSIKINGESKEIDDPTGTNTYKVNSLVNYTIEVVGEPSTPMGNIVWCTNEKICLDKGYRDPQGNADAVVEHGTVEIVSIENENGVLTREELEEKRFDDGWFEFKDGVGFAEIMAGAKVTVKFVPDYGYQLTKMQINDTEFKAEKEQSTFSFIMDDGPLHLSALFTKVDDVVKSSTAKVKSGSVKIGSSEITSGSTVLSVKDATLTDEQKSTFTTKAGDYKVSNVFDIKLDQVVYKGKADDVWTKPLGYSEDLKTPAVITLSLDEGVDGNTVVLIHEKEDGTYETIETTYDETTHTISFSTSSFSNYAIASKTVVTKEPKDEITNPQTYDGLMSCIVLSVISLSGIVGIITYRKKQNI